MSTQLSDAEKTKLRRELGLLSTIEAAGILGCEPIDISRQVCFGMLAYNSDATGQLLVSQADIHGYAGRGCPNLKTTPKIHRGWFSSASAVPRGEFVTAIKQSSIESFQTRPGSLNFVVGFLVGEAHSFAKKYGERQQKLLPGRPTLVESFYAAGPSHFKKFQSDFASHARRISIHISDADLSAKAGRFGVHRTGADHLISDLMGQSFGRCVSKSLEQGF